MTDYLIKSGLLLIIFLGIYHLWLEKEKMYVFNRIYLLFSLAFGLGIPLIKITLPGEGITTTPLPLSKFVISDISTMIPLEVSPSVLPQNTNFVIVVYGVITVLLLARFTYNAIFLMTRASRNFRIDTPEGVIILIKEKLAPHSFLFFTFLNEDDYLKQRIEKEIITHEFTHVRQKHSADLLFVELVMAIFWFNPVFMLYKKAIQLNHEFLADDAVIESSCSVSTYQQLLLQKATLKPVKLASNFNYSITKKRFKMMKKETSKTWKIVKAISLLPIGAILVLTFSDNIFAKKTPLTSEIRMASDNIGQITKDEYYKGAYMRYINNAGVTIRKKYEELTAQEKSLYPAPVQPTEALMASWKDTQKFVVLIGYEKPLEPLSNYRAKDFVSYYANKSVTNGLTYITLIRKDFLEKVKELGGDFNREGNEFFLAPPPPVMIPSTNN